MACCATGVPTTAEHGLQLWVACRQSMERPAKLRNGHHVQNHWQNKRFNIEPVSELQQ
jgi:hypothetical protein